jgi:hypothetical protein
VDELDEKYAGLWEQYPNPETRDAVEYQMRCVELAMTIRTLGFGLREAASELEIDEDELEEIISGHSALSAEEVKKLDNLLAYGTTSIESH